MKYRILERTYKDGSTSYIPQFRRLFIYWCFQENVNYYGTTRRFDTLDSAKRWLENRKQFDSRKIIDRHHKL